MYNPQKYLLKTSNYLIKDKKYWFWQRSCIKIDKTITLLFPPKKPIGTLSVGFLH